MTPEEIKKIEETIVSNLGGTRPNFDPTRSLGGGIPKDKSFTLTGKVLFEKNEQTPSFSYYYLETEEGVKISVTSFAGIGTYTGYEFCAKEDLPTGKAFTDEKGRTVYATMLAEDVKNANFITERNLVKMISYLMQNEEKLKGKTTEFLGACVRPITLRKKTKLGDIDYPQGAQTYIVSKCWSKVEI